ncbi:MAG: hypothetical protein JWR35_396 [Marmoricola sp.]|nr:hypothetical protein [Marmoricola sp.]
MDSENPDEHEPQPERRAHREAERDARTGRSAASERIRHQTQWVEQQISQAMARGDFDNLPGAGKPIKDLGSSHDPDWWVKKLIEREQITGVLPPALMLRKEDAELDGVLDRENVERIVREILEDFNKRVISARRQLQGGPPVITKLRDVEAEVTAWRDRRTR